MKGIIFSLVCAAFSVVLADSTTVSNKVVFVNQDGEINAPEVVATVGLQAANETQVLISAAKAEAAEAAANETQEVIRDVVANIVANSVVIYRKGFMASFDKLISYDPEKDKLLICDFRMNNAAHTATISYVATFDCGSVKPLVLGSDNLLSPTADWGIMDDASVSDVVVHNDKRMYGGIEYSKWYEITVPFDIDGQHFYVIGIDGDTPDGDGATLDVVNGFTGGFTGTVVEGNLTKVYKGGLLMSVVDAEAE